MVDAILSSLPWYLWLVIAGIPVSLMIGVVVDRVTLRRERPSARRNWYREYDERG